MKDIVVDIDEDIVEDNIPAIHAVMKQAILPAIKARIDTRSISFFLSGATAANAPIIIPKATMFENPHSA